MPEGTNSPPPGFMCNSFPPRSQLTGVIADCTGPQGGERRGHGHAPRVRPTNRKTQARNEAGAHLGAHEQQENSRADKIIQTLMQTR